MAVTILTVDSNTYGIATFTNRFVCRPDMCDLGDNRYMFCDEKSVYIYKVTSLGYTTITVPKRFFLLRKEWIDKCIKNPEERCISVCESDWLLNTNDGKTEEFLSNCGNKKTRCRYSVSEGYAYAWVSSDRKINLKIVGVNGTTISISITHDIYNKVYESLCELELRHFKPAQFGASFHDEYWYTCSYCGAGVELYSFIDKRCPECGGLCFK